MYVRVFMFSVVFARFLDTFVRSIAIITLVFTVYVKVIIDVWVDDVQDRPMGRNPNTLAHILGASHPRSGVPIRHVLRKLRSLSDFK